MGSTTILAVYAPCEENQEEASEFYDELQSVMNTINKRDVLLLLGDMNARIGIDNDGIETVMGAQALREKRNANGDKLVEFCLVNKLTIQGTRFSHLDIHKATWRHPGSGEPHQIDHVITNSIWKSTVEDVRVYRGADIGSDHLLVVAKMKLHWKRRPKKERDHPWSFRRISQIQRQKYAQSVTRALEERRDNGTVEGKWARIRDIVQNEMQKKVREAPPLQRNEWLSRETLDIVEKKRKAFEEVQKVSNWSTDEGIAKKTKYQQLNKEAKKAVRQDKKRWFEQVADTMKEAA
ncbi:MAG: hypothetical protein GY852_11035, partial [bacterium]|nr:hypothetical protein [bacterium]